MNSKKVLKTGLKVLGIIMLFVIISSIVLPFIFKKQIVEAVKSGINNNINAKADFKDYHLSLFSSFPNFTLGLDNFNIVGVGQFDKDTLINLEKVNVTLDLFSVISGSHYTIKKIDLEHPRFQLIVAKDGKVNWDITKPSPPTTKAEPASAFKLSLKKVIINQGYLLYDDRQGGMKAELSRVDHVLKGDMSADFASLYTKTSIEALTFVYGGVAYLNKARVTLESDLDADLKNFKFTFKENEGTLNALSLGFDGWFAMPGNDMVMDLKYVARKSEFKNFLSLIPALYAKDFDKLEASGKMGFDGFVKGTYNEKSIPGFGVNLLVENGNFKYPSLPSAVEKVNVNLKVNNPDGQPDHTVIDLKKLHVEMAGNPVDMQMLVTTPVSDANINGNIKGRLNLADVKKFYPLDAAQELNGIVTADVSMKGRMSSIEKKKYEEFQAKGEMEVKGMSVKSKDQPTVVVNTMKLVFTPQFVELPVCDLKLGKSDMQAHGRVDNMLAYVFKNEKLTGTFTSTSTLLDANEWMTGKSQTPAVKDTTPLSVFEVPANIDFTLSSSFGQILYDNMVMSRVIGVIKIADRKVLLENLKMNMLGGTMGVTGYYSTQKAQPQVDFALDVAGFDIPQTFKTFVTVQKLAPIAGKCSGKYATKLHFSTSLDKHMMPVMTTLAGEGLLSASNVLVQGSTVTNKVADVLKIEKFRKLSLDKVSLDFKFADGKMIVKPTTINLDKIKATISGYNSLDQTIDYNAVFEIPREMFGGQANAVLDNLVSQAKSKGVPVNPGSTIVVGAKIGGTFLKPTVSTDMKNSASSAINEVKQQAVQQVQAKVQQEVTKVKADASAQAQKILADAESKAAQIRAEAKKGGDALVAEANKQAKDLETKAGNPIAKMAAKEAGKKLVKEAQKKSDQLQAEADKKAKAALDEGKAQAEKLK